MAEIKKEFGKQLQRLRKEQGLSQPDLGKKVGTSATMISRYENGVMPSIEVAFKVARALGVTLDALVSASEMPDLLGDKIMLDRWKALDWSFGISHAIRYFARSFPFSDSSLIPV
jgi:transcriptional regulator with XRE-family HTH domain